MSVVARAPEILQLREVVSEAVAILGRERIGAEVLLQRVDIGREERLLRRLVRRETGELELRISTASRR